LVRKSDLMSARGRWQMSRYGWSAMMRSILPEEVARKCEHCGHPAVRDRAECPWCQHPYERESEQGNEDLYLKLVTANVLRLRRQYELAEAQCSEVLRRDPENGTAHSVLGDIARDRGNLRDAIEWYKMALDLNPMNSADRQKLEKVIDALYARGGQGKVLGKWREDVTETLGSTAAELRAARLPSALSVTLGAMLAVIMVVSLVVLVMGRNAAPVPTAAVAEPPSGAFVAAEGGLEPKAAAGAAAAEAPRFGEGVAPLEIALADRLQTRCTATDPQCEVSGADIDPQDGIVTVRFSMPRLWSVENTRETILRVAVPLALEAARWDARVAEVRMRGDVRQEGQPDRHVFSAKADPQQLAKLGPDPATWEASKAFDSTWWESDLRQEQGSPPSPGVE
jgi:hypothetical protein